MALGFTTSAAYGPRNIVPDRGMTANVEPRVHTISFGDGYEQRLSMGINNSAETYNVVFVNRGRAEIDDIAGYFKSLNGITAFNFTIPDYAETQESTGITSSVGEKTIRVICSSWDVTYQNDNFFNLTATFKRVYEA